MKKKISILMVLAMVMQMFVVMNISAATEKAYTFEKVMELATTAETGNADTTDVPSRVFGIATKAIGNKVFAYMYAVDGLWVYDVTDPESPSMEQEISGWSNDINGQLAIIDDKLFIGKKDGGTYTYTIGSDGKLTDETKIFGEVQIRTVEIDGKVFATTNGNNHTILVENSSGLEASVNLNAAPRNIGVTKKSDGTYRFFVMGQKKVESTDKMFAIAYDYNPSAEENKFTKVIEIETSLGTGSNFGNASFLSDTKVVFQRGNSGNGYIYTLDFTDSANLVVSSISDGRNSATPIHVEKIAENEIVFWAPAVKVFDYSSSTPNEVAGTDTYGVRATDISTTNGVTYWAADSKVLAIKLKRDVVNEIDVPEPINNVSIGTVNTQKLTASEENEAPTSIFSLTVADVGDKKMLYFISDTSETEAKKIFAYELADDGTATYVNSVTDTNNCASEAGIYVKDGYLIYASYDSSKSYLNFVAVDPDTGAIGSTVHHTVTAVSNTNYVHKIKLIDNLLFVNANSNIFVYELEDIANKTINKTTVGSSMSSGCGGMEVEKVSNIKYRVYAFERHGNNTTMTMNISDVKYVFGNVSVADQNANLTKAETVETFPASTKAYLNKVAENKLILANDSSWEYIIDVVNPAAPKITGKKTITSTAVTPMKLQIDKQKSVEISRNNRTDSGVVDYSVSDATGSKTKIDEMAGKSACINNGVLYSASGADLITVTLYNNSNSVFAKDSAGKDVENTLTSEMTIGAYINNATNADIDVKLMAAIYNSDGRFTDVQVFNKKAKPGFNKIEQEIDLNSFAYYSPIGSTLKVFAWNDNITPYADVKVIGPAQMSGDAFENDGVKYKFYAGENTESVEGLVLLNAHGNGGAYFTSESLRDFCDENNWAVMLVAEPTEGADARYPSNWTDTDRINTTVENAIKFYAEETDHPELVNVPIATIAHSSATNFAMKYAYHNRDKVFAVIGWRIHNSQVFSDVPGNVPVMVNQGEKDTEYGNNANQLELSTNLVNEGYLVNYCLASGADHGTGGFAKDECIIQPFLMKAYAARVPSDADFAAGAATLNTITFGDGYYGDLSNVANYFETDDETKSYTFGEIGEYTNTNSLYSWLFDEDYAKIWKEYSETRNVQ